MKNVYETSDLGVASALACLGYQIKALDRNSNDPRRVIFCFEIEQGLPEAIAAYWTGELKVSALHLLTHQKLLKQRIYSAQQ